MERPFAELKSRLDPARPVLVQTHDFPDHDAAGAAFALSELLKRQGFDSAITAGGEIDNLSVRSMLDKLGIMPIPFADARANPRFQTIVVDGSPSGGTIATVAGTLVGVVDHHPAKTAPDCPFADVRLDAGSCSSIVWSYWREAGEIPDRPCATALLAGIQLDTDFLSRGVGKLDLEAHYRLFFLGNGELARELVRTFLGTDQLVPLGHALAGCLTRDGALVTEVSGDCPAELLSVLADFLLRLRDVTFVTVVAESEGGYHVSARNRDRSVNAGAIIARAIGEAGSGGGHPHMAGGVFRPGGYPGAEAFLRKIIDEITAYRSKNETDGEAN